MTKAEDILKAAIELYGEPNQLIVCMEELSELSKEPAKCLRGYDSTAYLSDEVISWIYSMTGGKRCAV